MIIVAATDGTDNGTGTFGPFASEGYAERWCASLNSAYVGKVTYGRPEMTPMGEPFSDIGDLYTCDRTGETDRIRLYVVRMEDGTIVGPFGTVAAAKVFAQPGEIVDLYRPLLDAETITEPFSGEAGWGILTVWYHEDDSDPVPSCMGDLVGEFYGRCDDMVFDLTGEFYEGR